MGAQDPGNKPDRITCNCDPQASSESPEGTRRLPSRRRLFRVGMAGTALGALSGVTFGLTNSTREARAQNPPIIPTTPEEAIQRLLAGNRNYMNNDLTSISVDLHDARERTVNEQKPWAAVLSCADSRVPVEWLFDVVIGQVFVCRVAGNIATPENIASLEYGVAKLGCLAILALGHGDCGAVKAARGLAAVEDTQISSLYSYITPAIAKARHLDQAIKDNARFQAKVLKRSSKLFRDRIASGSLQIAAGFYDLASGQVTLLT